MKKIIVGLISVVMVGSIALPALAQVASNPAMPAYPQYCALSTNRSLYRGVSGTDVLYLQQYLQSQGYLYANPTGYYGPMTARAVAQWQASQGIGSVGIFGPLSRVQFRTIACGTVSTVCRPITYMPIACSDGVVAQPTRDASGCITGYSCPVANFTPPYNCRAWNDGCNVCSRTTPGGPAACTIRACLTPNMQSTNAQSIWAGQGYCSAYFDNTVSQQPPVLSGLSGPTTLAAGTNGTWSVNASDPQNGTLSYAITWGDEYRYPYMQSAQSLPYNPIQSSTFTHTYASAGTYTITITVTNASGQTAQTSTTVTVTSTSGTVCPALYAPVCGQPPEPACRYSNPACMLPTPGPQTYSNSCMLSAAGATFLYYGQCSAQY